MRWAGWNSMALKLFFFFFFSSKLFSYSKLNLSIDPIFKTNRNNIMGSNSLAILMANAGQE